jgi:hypothetical protein
MRLRRPHAKIMIFADLLAHAVRPTACEMAIRVFAKMVF